MIENDHIKYMQRCLELASKAEGLTYPNPMVGAVIVNEGKIIGEGFHLRAGEPHAEVNAINSVSDKSLLKHSTLYVNLEPCSHFGKTPPCADLIISAEIPKVVIGAIDTSDKVSGKSIEKLRKAGCEVITGILEEECRFLNRRFFTSIEKNRPYVILKWAQSADGFIDIIRKNGHPATPTWITGVLEKKLVHKWRSEEQAILVGAGTVRADNPRLDVREWTGNQPIRIVLSRSGQIDKNLSFFRDEGSWLMFTAADSNDKRVITIDNSQAASVQILRYLHSKNIQSIFIEGGAKTLNHFIETGLWDEARVFTGKMTFGAGIKAPALTTAKPAKNVELSGSRLDVYDS
jgi:diaminohydroxyphosphoribosylaminopyrimidine deaminase/5-amino-6-(5-phosphoribosylamino)uracil reductase